MRLAFYTYSYTDRLEMPLEPALEKIAATGYDGIDISGIHGPSADPRSVTPELRAQTRSIAERLSLTIEAVITHANLANSLFTDEPLDLKGSVDLAVDVGAPLVVFHMGGPKEDDCPASRGLAASGRLSPRRACLRSAAQRAVGSRWRVGRMAHRYSRALLGAARRGR